MKAKPNRRRHRSRRKKAEPLIKDSHGRNNANKNLELEDVEIEYVVEPPNWEDIPGFGDKTESFSNFLIGYNNKQEDEEEKDLSLTEQNRDSGQQLANGASEAKNNEYDKNAEAEEGKEALSAKKAKRLNRMSITQLKSMVEKPEVVEWYDVTAADPLLLVNLKSYRNTIPVPMHWCQKRKYLQGKRGIEKKPFELPEFIKATGIAEIRSAVKEKEDASKLKAKTRERHQPKMGKIDMDYQKLHDAFFRWQTKPWMSIHGDMYYEGKEFETKLKTIKPGKLSEELTAALGIPPLAPPPWLINMQRHGPPPSYPQLKIPGLNAPIPEGASWGYHPGCWGKPPVDEYGRPLYGDIFGTIYQELQQDNVEMVDKNEWGKIIDYEDEYNEADNASLEDEDSVMEDASSGIQSQSTLDIQSDAYAESIGGISSVPQGLETPESIELVKNVKGPITESKQLYTVIQEKQVPSRGFLGPQHIYDVPLQTSYENDNGFSKPTHSTGVEMSFNPEELEEGIDTTVLKSKYENSFEISKKVTEEDLSDIAPDNSAKKQTKRRQKKDETKSSNDKKHGLKSFKF